ncbi:hypothetical protein Amsp01_075380 [Amycolatopsis sp. NBRC 101858]|nr:hypothetical protein Amsp01_075380 [Amycolatopsis sp. NBRC 101858]
MQHKGSRTREHGRLTGQEQRRLRPGRQFERVGGGYHHSSPRLGQQPAGQRLADRSLPQNLDGLTTQRRPVSPSPIDHDIENEALPAMTEGPHARPVDNLADLWTTLYPEGRFAYLESRFAYLEGRLGEGG